jgi:hypothetical protein
MPPPEQTSSAMWCAASVTTPTTQTPRPAAAPRDRSGRFEASLALHDCWTPSPRSPNMRPKHSAACPTRNQRVRGIGPAPPYGRIEDGPRVRPRVACIGVASWRHRISRRRPADHPGAALGGTLGRRHRRPTMTRWPRTTGVALTPDRFTATRSPGLAAARPPVAVTARLGPRAPV